MNRWKCFKEVDAFKIAGVSPPYNSTNGVSHAQRFDIRGGSGVVVSVGADWVDKHRPECGGYFIRYNDGYQSFSPAEAFESGYALASIVQSEAGVCESPASGFGIGEALRHLHSGCKLRRASWNGKGQFVVLMPALKLPPFSSQEPGAKVNDRTAKHIGVDTPLDSQPYLALQNAQGKWQPGWVASISDLLANDWEIA